MTRVLTAVVVLLLAVPTAVRLLGDHGQVPLVAVVSLTPYAVPLLALALALLLWRRRWWAAAAAGVLLTTNLVWLVPLWVPDRAPVSGATGLTVMTANLRLGEADPAAVVAAVRARHVDVLALEELTPEAVVGLRRAGLERELGHHVLEPLPGSSGAGLWSRLPLTSAAAWDATSAMPSATLAVGGRRVAVHVLHPYPTLLSGSAHFRADYATLTERVAALDPATPTVLLGDLNATVDHSELRALMGQRFRDAPELAGSGLLRTFTPSRRLPPLLQLDHVLVDPWFGVTDTAVVDLPGSDHRAVVARLGLAPRS